MVQSKAYWSKFVLTFLCPLLIMTIPINNVFTTDIRTFLAIVLLAVLMLAFELFNNIVPALITTVLFIMSGIATQDIVLSAWTSNVIWFTVGAQLFASGLDECGLLKRIAYKIISKTNGTFTSMMWGIAIASIVIDVLTFINGWLLVITLSWSICKTLKLKHKKEAALIVMATQVGISTISLPVFYPAYAALMEANVQNIFPTFTITWLVQLYYNWPIFIYMILYMFLLTKIFRTKDLSLGGDAEYFKREYEKLGAMSTNEKKASVVLALLFIYILTSPIHNLPLLYAFLLFPLLFFMPGMNIATSESIKSLDLSMFAIIATFASFGTIGEIVGIGTVISNIATPLLSQAGSIITCYALLLLGTIANLFVTPMGLLGALSDPVAHISASLGMNPYATMMSLFYSLDMLFFPYEDITILVLFSGGYALMKDYLKLSVLKICSFFIFFGVIIIPYWHLIGIL